LRLGYDENGDLVIPPANACGQREPHSTSDRISAGGPEVKCGKKVD
jgi:hypothetical protein